MSIAAAQYAKFKEQAVEDSLVWTFLEEDDYLVFPLREGEAIPFWSSQPRLKKVCQYHPKYSRYQQVSLPLSEFIELLGKLKQENINIGVNWSGERLAGYDVSTDDLLAGLQYYIDKRSD